MPANDVAARDRTLGAARLVRQRPNTGVRIEHAFAKTGGTGKDALRFAGEVRALTRVDARGAGITLVALVGGPNQQQVVPRQDEKRPVVGARFDIDANLWRAGERRHDDVAAFRTADQARVTDRSEHLVDPRACRVDDQRRARTAPPARRLPLDADRAAALDAKTRDARTSLELP